MLPNAQRIGTIGNEDPRIDRYRLLLGQSALFRGCSSSAIDDLARRVQVRTRPAATLIVAQDEPGDSMFILVSGRVRVALFGESGRELTLGELHAGEYFGEMSLIDNRPRSANVIAIDDTVLLVLTKEAFTGHLRAHPQTALNLMSELSRRLRRADETIAQLALQDVEARHCRTLERLAREEVQPAVSPADSDGDLVLRRRPTQQDLANMVGSCRETVSRTLTAMAKRGLVVPRGRTLVLTRALLSRRQIPA